MKAFKYLSPIALILALTVVGCKPDAKRELKKWQNNQKKMTELQASYPNLKPQLVVVQTGATKAWTKTESIKDLEQKAEAMSKANDAYDHKLVRQLGSIKSRNESIDNSVKSILKKKFPRSKLDRVRSNIADVRKKQRESRSVLRNADGSTMDSAQAAADKAVGLLIEADGILSRTKSMAGKKKKSKFKKKKKKKKD